MNPNMRCIFIILICFIELISIVTITSAYKVKSPDTVHQHITNESQYLWNQIPYEMINQFREPLDKDLNGKYDNYEDDIITGSGEEDLDIFRSTNYINGNHFWQPDDPYFDNSSYTRELYDRGLLDDFQLTSIPAPLLSYFLITHSSYNKANEYWEKRVLHNYLEGNIDESYYWLGRVAHLLEDTTVPAHMHLDMHAPAIGTGDDLYEEYTANNFTAWSGMDYKDTEYNFLHLPNADSLNWSRIEEHPNDYFFRLFWYSAQKTQYFASDDVDGKTKRVDYL